MVSNKSKRAPKPRTTRKKNVKRRSRSPHSARELASKVRGASTQSQDRGLSRRERLKQRVKEAKVVDGGKALQQRTKSRWEHIKHRADELWAWYKGLPLYKRVLWGLIVIPIVLLAVAINVFLMPLLLPLLPVIGAALITLAKLLFVVSKVGAFAIYISYKVFKTFLGFYYSISRMLSGRAAGKAREQMALMGVSREAELKPAQLKVDEALTSLKLTPSWKRLEVKGEASETGEGTAEERHPIEHTLLFSYLRYFLIGQIRLYVETWRERKALFTIWRPESRETLKDQLAFVGATIFRPHSIGPHVKRERVLLPGDATLLSAQLTQDALHRAVVRYELQVPWKTWRFSWRWPFASSELHHARWAVELPCRLQELSEDDLGWRGEAVLELGGPRVDDQGDELRATEPGERSAEL